MGNEADQVKLNKVSKWKSESEQFRLTHDWRWARNISLIKGLPIDGESTVSKTRKHRSKLYFRKIWATSQRMVASFYAAFLRDPDSFRLEGRDTEGDQNRAKVLQKMVEYRRDLMMRTRSLFLKFIWAFMDIVDLGWCVGKMRWVFDDKRDEPEFVLYPPEQVYPDLAAETPDEMDYIIFENYLTLQDMKQMGYSNLENVEVESLPYSQVRSRRHAGTRDPMVFKDTEYPAPGQSQGDQKEHLYRDRYRVWECFYKVDGEIMFMVTNGDKCILQDEEPSIYGDRYPVVMGVCLTEAHKMIGEGLPEPLEGPQISLNTNLNQRKDNISLILNRESFVSRYGNVDLLSLSNSRPGGITMMDDVNAVKDREVQDVTRSSYMEASADEEMMQEMSGITPPKMGMETAEKATVAQINYSEANAKIDMYTAIVGETFFRNFYSLLAHMIQLFETDERVFRVANAHLQKEEPDATPIYDIEDFEADCIVQVGLGNVGREIEIRNTLTAIDRANMANQTNIQILQAGAQPPDGVQMINTALLFRDLLPKLGKKEFDSYFYMLPPPEAPGGAGGNMAQQAARGMMQPQMGESNIIPFDTGAEGGVNR